MPYGTIKVDNITFTDNSVDKTVSLSGLIQNPTFTGNVTVTGTISGDVIRGGTTISGVTVTGTTANFVSGVFTTQISGATITGTTVAATTGNYTSLTGVTTTGTTANFVSGVFTTQISGATITGTTVATTTGSFVSLTGTTATFTSGIIASGTAALPSLAILSDPNTGIYSPGADQLAISTAGSGRLFVDASGNVSLSQATTRTVTIPRNSGDAFQLRHGTGADVLLYFVSNDDTTLNQVGLRAWQGSSYNQILLGGNNTTTFTIAGSERMRLDASGRLGIGTSSPGATLDVNGSIRSNDIFTLYKNSSDALYIGAGTIITGGTSTDIAFRSNQNGSVLFSTNGTTERMRIDATGRVGIGTASPGYLLTVSGGATSLAANQYLRFGAGLFASGDGSATNYLFTGSSGLAIRNAADTSEFARIDSSGRLLVGTSTARTDYFNNGLTAMLQVEGTNYGGNVDRACVSIVNNNSVTVNEGPVLILGRSNGPGLNSKTLVSSGARCGVISFQGADGNDLIDAASIAGEIDGTPGANDMPGRLVFSTTADGSASPTARVTINSAGDLLVGKTAENSATAGFQVRPSGLTQATVNGDRCFDINRLTNDGSLVIFYQDNTQEGTISVSGTTVSYNGAHLSRWSQLPSGAERTEILRGSILSNIDEMCEWIDPPTETVLWAEGDELPEGVSVGDVKEQAKSGGPQANEQLNRMKVSDVEGDKNVSGVFQAWDDDDDTYTDDFYCAMTGDFIIRIAEGVTVERGDLLMSAGDGTAKPQDDDIIRSKTIAKVTSTNVSCTYPDGSYCVPCVLMAC